MADHTALWLHPMKEDGWVYSHDAIRADMTDTAAAVARMASAETLEDWELPALQKWWRRCDENIRQHHDHEERIFFPRMRARESCVLAPKMSEDHVVLMKDLAAVTEAVGNAKTAADLEACGDLLKVLSDHMLPHLAEEEADVLVALRKAFTPKEVRKTMMNPMIKEFTWLELPHLYRRFSKEGAGGMPVVRAHAVKVLGMPGFVFDYIDKIPKKIRRYNVEYGFFIEELLDPSKRAGFEAERVAFAKERGRCVVM